MFSLKSEFFRPFYLKYFVMVLIIWHSYIGIPINFHEESGIVTFWSNELSAPLDVSKGYEALRPEELEDYGFL